MSLEEFLLGDLKGIKVYVVLSNNDIKEKVNLEDLPKEIKDKAYELSKEKRKNLLDNWMKKNDKIIITKDQYYRLINLNNSILKNRSVDNRTYIKFLLNSKKKEEINEIFKNYEIKGYSNKKKGELIDFLIEQLSDDEIFEYIEENELDIISLEFAKSLQILNQKSTDKLENIRIINLELHELELKFSNFHDFETTTSITINKDTIKNPERDCDCIIGKENGFCCHFWIGFIISFKRNFFRLQEWRLTQLPSNFETIVKDLKIK